MVLRDLFGFGKKPQRRVVGDAEPSHRATIVKELTLREAGRPFEGRELASKPERLSEFYTFTPVEFSFHAPQAKYVFVAGTFNGWSEEALPLVQGPSGAWTVRTELAPGTYQYKFVVDGNWIPDPKAARKVTDPFGGENSVLEVPLRD